MYEFSRDKKPCHLIQMVGNRPRMGCCLFAIAILISVCWGGTATALVANEQKRELPNDAGIDIVLIDSTLAHFQDLQRAVRSGIQVMLFDGLLEPPDQILLRTIGRVLAAKKTIRSLSIVSHGARGAFKFGNRWIDRSGLLDDAKTWRMLGRLMNDFGHIYLYGCNVVNNGQAGADLLETLSDLTHTIVFASDNVTGRGGDWELEAVSANGRNRPGMERIQVLDTASLVDLPITLTSYSETAWSGTNTFTDDGISFTLSLTGGGTIDWSYVGGTNTLTISDNDNTTLASNLTISDNNGGLLIDTITLDTDLGTINSTADIGTRLQIAASIHVDHMVVGGGNGTIAEILFLGLGSQNLGTVYIDANVTTLALAAGMDLAAGSDMTVTGNVDAITGIDAFNSGAYLAVDGDLGYMSVGGIWGGALAVGGDVDTISVINELSSSGVIDISGNVATGLYLNSNLQGTITVSGNLADIDVGNNWGGTLTVGGDVGNLFAANDLFSSGLIDIGGNINDLTIDSEVDGTIFIGGNVGAITCNFMGAGDITVGGDLNDFFSMHEYYGVLTAKKVIGPLAISADHHSTDGFYHSPTYPIETLVVYNGATKSISGALTLDLDADDSSGESPVDFAGTFAFGNGPVAAVDGDAYISNSASSLTSLTATILDLQDGASEVLACHTNGTSINASYNSATGILTLSNADTVGHYEQVLRTITYDNTANAPTEGDRRIVFAASNAGGTLVTNSATAFINVSPIGSNNPPTGADNMLTVAEDASHVVQAADFGYSDSDGDPMAQVQITALPTSGTLAYNAGAVALNQVISKTDIDLGLLIFTPEPNATGSPYASFDFKVCDGSDYSVESYTLTVDVTATNDAPTGAGGTIAVAEDSTHALNAADFGYADPDGDMLSQVQITLLPSKGNLAYNGSAVVLNQVISKADIDLGLLTYTPEADVYGTGYSFFRFMVHDGMQYALGFGTILFDVTAVNDPPSINDHHFIIYRNITGGARIGSVSAFDADPEDKLVFGINDRDFGAMFVMDSATGEISVKSGVDLAEGDVTFYTFSVRVSDGEAIHSATITIQILAADEESGSGNEDVLDDKIQPPIILGLEPPNPPDIEADDPPESVKPVVEGDVGTADETGSDKLKGSGTPSQSNIRQAIRPHADRMDQTVVTPYERQSQGTSQYVGAKETGTNAGNALWHGTRAMATTAPQGILDIPLDNINMKEKPAVSTWFGKLFVGTITILIPFLSMLVTWGLQGTSLLASTLSAIPFWRTFDPLPILDAEGQKDQSQMRFNGSTEREYQDKQDRAEAMFDTAKKSAFQHKRRKDLR